MPEGKSISFAAGEYPELDGLPDGSKVKLTIDATLQAGQGGEVEAGEPTDQESGEKTLVFDNVQIETAGMADRELSSMTKQEPMSQPAMKKVEDM